MSYRSDNMNMPELDIPGVKPKKIVRVFLGHSKSDTDGSIEAMKSTLIRILTHASAGRAIVEVVPGRDDFEANMKRAGGWDAWAIDVVDRIDFSTRERVYSAIVVTSENVGGATAKIVQRAISVGVRVMLLNGAEVKSVTGIDEIDRRDFRGGWRVRT